MPWLFDKIGNAGVIILDGNGAVSRTISKHKGFV